MLQHRRSEGNFHKPAIPTHPDLDAAVQYNRPNDSSILMIQSYARHVANTYKSTVDPDKEVQTVMMYRVLHRILFAYQIADEMDPNNPTTFWPYFQGEFNKDGELVTNPSDGMLYWLIPIIYEPKNRLAQAMNPPGKKPNLDDYVIVDYCKAHAGDTSK